MKTLSLFAIAIMFATAGMAQRTTDSSSVRNNQWQQNSDQTQPGKRSNKMNRWNKNDSSGHNWHKMDSTGRNRNYPNKNRMNNRQKANKPSVDSI